MLRRGQMMSKHKVSEQPQARQLRSLTDAELLTREFDASDPESLPGIHLEPILDEPPTVEFHYDMKARGRKVRCVYCRYENHFEGVVVSHPSGRRSLVGRDCALTLYGAAFGAQLIDFDAGRERKAYLRRKNRVLEVMGDLEEAFGELIADPSVQVFGDVKREWQHLMGSMWRDLADAAHGDGSLRVHKVVRDVVAEARSVERQGNLMRMERKHLRATGALPSQIMKEVVDDLGQIEGADFFRTRLTVSARLLSIQNEMRGLFRKLGRVDLPVREMRAAMIGLDKVGQDVRAEVEFLATAQAAFGSANLARIAAWASEKAKTEKPHGEVRFDTPGSRPVERFGRFVATERTFTRLDGARQWSVTLPQWFRVPAPGFLKALDDALRERPQRVRAA